MNIESGNVHGVKNVTNLVLSNNITSQRRSYTSLNMHIYTELYQVIIMITSLYRNFGAKKVRIANLAKLGRISHTKIATFTILHHLAANLFLAETQSR